MSELRKKNGHEKPWKVDYFGVGNENWGCGGNMTPSYYANLYRRYQTYVRNYHPDAPIFKICGGPNVDDTYWTENVLKTCYENAPHDFHGFMDGLSMHYYVHPEGWEIKGSATEFDDKVWYKTLSKALYIETLINHHTAIMDKYDPEKKIGLICDEWGTWFTCEPGTNPGFLYQQSTMRDALVAGLSLNVFNKHCDRVKMANIAQLINVLQAVILTDGPRMIKTPTYYVFHMYKYHQDAELVESYIDGVKTIGEEKEFMVPNLQESVSVDKDGVVTITINNLSIEDSEHVDIAFAELKPSNVTAAIVTNKMDAYNTFENPDVVKEEEFKAYTVSEDGISFEIPACSVVQFRVK
jgi:alpha-N-arabinofuranosidase